MYLRANLAFKIFDALDEPYYAGRGAYNMAVAQYGASDFATAEQSAILALNLLEESSRENKERRIISTYNLLGSIASAMGNYERAIDYREQALNYVDRDAEDRSSYYSIMNNLGSTQIDAGAYREALRYLSEVAEQTDLRESDPQLYAKVLTNQARANFALGNFDSVEANYLEALRINEDIGERISLPRSNYFLAEYYWDQRDTARAREHLQEGKRIALETEELDGLQDILKLQMLVDRENSAQYGLELSELKDSLIQEERLLRDKFARVRYQTDQYIAENQFLSRQRMMWIWVTAGIVLLGMALLVIINQRIRNQKLRFLQQQQEANQEIFNLMLTQNEKIEEGKQEEQKRISEELHDGVLGEMNGIRMVLLGLNGKEDEKSVSLRAQAIEKLKSVQEEIRGISHALSDAAYQKFSNFIVSIEDLLESTAGTAGLEHQLDFDREADWDGVSGEIKINLYRIIQECLQNTIKHARANKVVVELQASENTLVARICDDGRGFHKRRGKRGIGQKNIASRVQRLGGQWEIASSPGSGTEIRITIPRGRSLPSPSNEVLEGML
ncbi:MULTISPECIES: tetratricopeptide repeat-containing sensor histidine kinase [unclassified Robiginitalea]|uniref:tetratricopeptide repeat-containing sensor histidine kinase n=2 Tax=Flavobacteriaceae TaxID=49546 RepID=UPI00234B6AA8|nr:MULTISPECIES: tetratricopeptide repeat-containing sensor histidine kinase [unclassified Robiginitalea]MDC6354243.1 tetratricopeptide repeat protein [Robiginitalea sp. PM2]MDC6374510.1 tetratricopeptide repeat protein [Robiginitalea sp. SP8]